MENPRLCANKCGFYGSAANNNLCSRCYADLLKAEMEKSFQGMCITDDHCTQGNGKGLSNSDAALDHSMTSTQESSRLLATNASTAPTLTPSMRNRCQSCNKKVGLTGFKCRCGNLFCGRHRYPEEHACSVDLKGIGRQFLEKQNPLVKADKLEGRI